MKSDDVKKIIDKLAKDLSDSIDTQVLYTAKGWTIVPVPNRFFLGNCDTMLKWLYSHCGKHYYWDGHVAFKDEKDATLFLLRWA